MQPIATFADVLDDAAFASVERQRRLAEVVHGDAPYGGRWDADLSAGRLSFSGRQGRLDTPAHLVGTAAPRPGTWMWAWNNVNQLPAAVVAAAARTRELGERFGLAELTTPELPLRGDARQDAVAYATAAGIVNGGLPHYTADLGDGRVVAFLVETPLAALPAPSVETAATVVAEALGNGVVHDQRRALEAYAELRGFGVEVTGSDVVLHGPDGRLVVRFDGRSRITGLDAHAGPAR